MRDELRLHGLIGGGCSAEKNFLMKYDGINDIIKDLKGTPINVSIGDYVYNEFNSTYISDGNSQDIEYTKTTPMTLTTNSFTIGRPSAKKLVRLSDGSFVTAYWDTTLGYFVVNIMRSPFASWEQLCYSTSSHFQHDYSMETDGTNIFLLSGNSGVNLHFMSFNAFTQSNSNVSSISVGASFTSKAIGSSLHYSTDGVLHATFSAYTTTRPNTMNVLYIKSTDKGATWSSVEFATTVNTAGRDYGICSISCNSDNVPIIACTFLNTNEDAYAMRIFSRYTGTFSQVMSVSSSTPVMTVGNIIGIGSNMYFQHTNANNSYVSYSSNKGNTWANTVLGVNIAIQGLSLSTTGKLFALYRNASSNLVYKESTDNGMSFGSEILLLTNPGILNGFPYISPLNIAKPVLVYTGTTFLRFVGQWTDTVLKTQVIPPMSLATNKTELQAIYADTLKMHSPRSDARYQGFVSKKDYWTTDLQELDWNVANIKKDVNAFGLIGDMKRIANGTVVVTTASVQTINLDFQPSKVFIYPIATVDQFSETAFFILSDTSDIKRQQSNTITSIPSIKLVTSTNTNYAYNGTTNVGSIGTKQFNFSASANQTYVWYALEK